MKILVTGAAGFIGFHLVNRLLQRGDEVVGLDSINDYYDPQLKLDRLSEAGIPVLEIAPGQVTRSTAHPAYSFIKLKLEDQEGMDALFAEERFDAVVNLAAQAGVRFSITKPRAYINSNLVGFMNVLEGSRNHGVKHLVYASSSSVYGLNETMPFSTHHNVDHPVSLYAASKKSNELMAHAYSHLFDLPTTGLRFFTVYGPWGRPDMALFLFVDAIQHDKPIKVFNYGKMKRDFTYVGDIVEGITRVIDHPPKGNPDWNASKPDPDSSPAPYRIYNIGNQRPIELLRFIEAIEEAMGKEAAKEMLPIQPGDVAATWADTSALSRDLGYSPDTQVEEGVKRFVEWYKAYYKVDA